MTAEMGENNVMENKKVYQKQHQAEYRLHDTTLQELLPDPLLYVFISFLQIPLHIGYLYHLDVLLQYLRPV